MRGYKINCTPGVFGPAAFFDFTATVIWIGILHRFLPPAVTLHNSQ